MNECPHKVAEAGQATGNKARGTGHTRGTHRAQGTGRKEGRKEGKLADLGHLTERF